MGFQFGVVSNNNLRGVHPKLVKLCKLVIAASTVDFRIVDGIRSLAEEKVNYAKGASQTMNSLHLIRKDGYGHAIDFALWRGGDIRWTPISDYQIIGKLFQAMGKANGIPIIWGGTWKTLKDYGHIELDRKVFPI